MKNLKLNGKAMLFGIFGSLIGTFPNVILKTILAFSNFGQACFDLFSYEIGGDFVITPCGFVSFVGGSFWETFSPVIVRGALFGLIGMRIGFRNARKKGYESDIENWKGLFWWSFFGGVLFDLIFIFMIFWPGM